MCLTLNGPALVCAFLLSTACSTGGGQDTNVTPPDLEDATPEVDNTPPNNANPVFLFNSQSGTESKTDISAAKAELFEGRSLSINANLTLSTVGIDVAVGDNTDTQHIVALAGFFPGEDGIAGEGPTSATLQYTGLFLLNYITGIAQPVDEGVSVGDVNGVSGNVTLDIAFSDGVFSGTGISEDASDDVLELDGQVDATGGLSGTVTFSGATAELEGAVFGSNDPDIDSAAVGVFAGSTETDVLVGGFVAENGT